MSRFLRRASLGVFSLIYIATPALAAPEVTVSIKPLQSLVAGVMSGIATPTVLIAGGGSPHTYSLRPSDAQALERSAVVFWVGPGFENFLQKPLATLGAKARVVSLMNAPGVATQPAREGGVWEAHDDEPAHDHDESEIDGHVWLDPANAKAMAAEIARVLSEVDPANTARYSANVKAITTKLDVLDEDIRTIVAPVKTKPFIVFHDAYQYFQRRYGVNAVGSITVSPDRMPGAKRVLAVKAKIAKADAVCVFAEPQFEPKLLRALIDGTPARIGTLDPEGSTLPTGEETYFLLMRGIAHRLAACLSGAG